MVPIVRLYGSENDAETAVSNLKQDGFPENTIFLLKPSEAGNADQAVQAEIDAGRMPKGVRRIATDSLKNSRCVLTVYTQYGSSLPATRIMDACNPVDTERLPEGDPDEGRTTSEFLGMPLLTERRLMTLSDEHGASKKRFTFESFFGLGLTMNKAAPLSDALNMKAVQERPKDWAGTTGMTLLSNNATPLSSALNMKTLIERKKDWTTSFGYALLSSEPAPLSSFLGLPVISRKGR
jgi:hypothetical protein